MSTHTKHKRKSFNMDTSDRSDSDLGPHTRNKVEGGRNYVERSSRDWSNKHKNHTPHFNHSNGRNFEGRSRPFDDSRSSFVKVTGPPPNITFNARGHKSHVNNPARGYDQNRRSQDINNRDQTYFDDNLSESFGKSCSVKDSDRNTGNSFRSTKDTQFESKFESYDSYSDNNEDWDSDNSSEHKRCYELSQSPPDPRNPDIQSVLHSIMHESGDDNQDAFTASLQEHVNHGRKPGYDYGLLIGPPDARNVIESRTNSGNKRMRISTESTEGKRSDTRIVVSKGEDGSSDEEGYSPKKGGIRSVIVKRSEDQEKPSLKDESDTSSNAQFSRANKFSSVQKLRLLELKKIHADKKQMETPPKSTYKSHDDDYSSPGPFGKHKSGKKQKAGAKVLYLPPHLRDTDELSDNDDDDSSPKGFSKKSKKYSEIQSIKSRLAEVDQKIKINAEKEESVMLQKDSEILKIRSKARPSAEGIASSDSEMLRQRTKAKSSKLDDESEILRLRQKSQKAETNTSSDSEMLRHRSKAHPKTSSVTEEEDILRLRRNKSGSSIAESEAVASSDSDILRIRRNLSNPDLKKAGSSKSWADIVDQVPELEDEDDEAITRKLPQSEPRKRTFNFSTDKSSPSDRKSVKQRLSLGDTTSKSKRSDWQKDTGKSRYEMFKEESEPKQKFNEPKGKFQDAANSWRNEMKGKGKRGKNNVWGKQSDSAAAKDHTDASLSYQERLDALRGKCSHMYSKQGGMDNISWKTGNWRAQVQRRFQALPPIPYIDTHCHIDFLFQRTNYQGTFAEYLEENAETVPATFGGCVAVFCNPSTYFSEKDLFLDLMDEANIHGAVGVHPKSATDYNPRVEKQMRWMLEHEKVVALGEIGLDYSGTFYQRAAIQKRVFIKQLKMAEELDLPIVIHCRDAEEDCVDIMEQTIDRNHVIHRHCWTGNWEDCEIWLDKFPNSFVGLTPLVTQTTGRAMSVREVAARLPLDRLLLETDAPYFLPSMIPKEAMKFTHPALAVTVATEVAMLQDVAVEVVLEAVAENTFKMYGIRPQMN